MVKSGTLQVVILDQRVPEQGADPIGGTPSSDAVFLFGKLQFRKTVRLVLVVRKYCQRHLML